MMATGMHKPTAADARRMVRALQGERDTDLYQECGYVEYGDCACAEASRKGGECTTCGRLWVTG